MEKNPFESSKDKYSQYSIDKDFAAFLEEKSRYAEKLTRLLDWQHLGLISSLNVS